MAPSQKGMRSSRAQWVAKYWVSAGRSRSSAMKISSKMGQKSRSLVSGARSFRRSRGQRAVAGAREFSGFSRVFMGKPRSNLVSGESRSRDGSTFFPGKQAPAEKKSRRRGMRRAGPDPSSGGKRGRRKTVFAIGILHKFSLCFLRFRQSASIAPHFLLHFRLSALNNVKQFCIKFISNYMFRALFLTFYNFHSERLQPPRSYCDVLYKNIRISFCKIDGIAKFSVCSQFRSDPLLLLADF